MYKQRVKSTLEEMIDMFYEMPLEYTDTVPIMGFSNGINGKCQCLF